MQANRRTFDRNDNTISQSPEEEETSFKPENRGKTWRPNHAQLLSMSNFGARYEIILFTRNGSLELEVSRYTNESEDVLTTFEPSSDTRSYQARAQPGTVRQRPCEATLVQGGRPYVFYAALLG